MPTLICVSIPVDDPAGALADAAAAKAAGAQLVEFRVDGYFTGSNDPMEFRRIVNLVTQSPLPCIVTCRPVAEGGHYDGDDSARVALFEALGTVGGGGSLPPRYLDVELATYTRSANLKQKINLAVGHPAQVRDLSTSLILSFHDPVGRPADLSRKVLAMAAEPAAAVLKIAFRARSVRDNLELFDLLKENAAGGGGGKPMIALAMGEFGLASRVLAPKFGGFLTFASLRPETATAPGQPTIHELLEVYRSGSIGPRTKVYGVLGWPLAHSRSPLLHNAAFAAAGMDAVFLPLPVPPEYEHFKASLHALIDHPHLDFAGCAVTIPHKEHLVRFAREQAAKAGEPGGIPWTLDPLAALCGAANTLVISRDAAGRGGATGATVRNTDGPAATGLLARAMAGGSLRGKRVAVLGAGGAARAIVASAVAAGATVTIHNRSADRARSLARDVGLPESAVLPLAEVAISRPDAIVNATSVGMAGPDAKSAANDAPIGEDQLRACGAATIVFDAVYSPRDTALLRTARSLGMPTNEGLEMLVEQAAEQFYPPDAAVRSAIIPAMRRAIGI